MPFAASASVQCQFGPLMPSSPPPPIHPRWPLAPCYPHLCTPSRIAAQRGPAPCSCTQWEHGSNCRWVVVCGRQVDRVVGRQAGRVRMGVRFPFSKPKQACPPPWRPPRALPGALPPLALFPAHTPCCSLACPPSHPAAHPPPHLNSPVYFSRCTLRSTNTRWSGDAGARTPYLGGRSRQDTAGKGGA